LHGAPLSSQDGQKLSPLCTHAFLLRRLTVAYKQKRFPRAIASDIESLAILGCHKGPAAGLFRRLKYLWSSCTGLVSAQSDLYRLTYAIEQLKSQGWINAVVSDEEWDNDALLVQEYSDTDAMLVRKSPLTLGFSDEGKLVAPVEFLVTGNLSVCIEIIQAYVLPLVMMASNRVSLQPEQ
jgi:hypothetical protein